MRDTLSIFVRQHKEGKDVKKGLYTPRKHQAEIEAGLARFSVLVCHRRFGKTVLSVNRLIEAARKTNVRIGAELYRSALQTGQDRGLG